MSLLSASTAKLTSLISHLLVQPLRQLWQGSSNVKRYTLILPTGVTIFNYIMCRYRLYPHNIFYRAWFSTTLVGTLISSFVGVAFPANILGKLGIIKKRTAEKIAAATVNFGCNILFKLNPQMRIHYDYERVSWDEVPKHNLISANHNSYLDAFIYCAVVPALKNYVHQKGFMKGSLRNIPLVGYLFFEVLGHFPVHYSSEETENFSVDKEKQQKELQRVLQWMSPEEQNSFVYSPEGRVNPTPETIQNLRYGMLKVIFEQINPQVPWYHVTFWPTHQFWGRKDFTGGLPCDLWITLQKYEIPRSDPSISKDGGKTCDNVDGFAKHLQKFMQDELDYAKDKHALELLRQKTYRTAADWWKFW